MLVICHDDCNPGVKSGCSHGMTKETHLSWLTEVSLVMFCALPSHSSGQSSPCCADSASSLVPAQTNASPATPLPPLPGLLMNDPYLPRQVSLSVGVDAKAGTLGLVLRLAGTG